MIGIVSTGVEAIKNEAQIDGIKKAAFITKKVLTWKNS